ncbi:MAG: hypothetical protein MJZ20_13340 [Bacteroidaceae bacterium]|nr:hypothetical protein [Bacteroidaceae bacterium]
MKSKLKSFFCGLLVVFYVIAACVSGYFAAVCMFLVALKSSGIVTIGAFLLSVVFMACGIKNTYAMKDIFNIEIKKA